MISIVVTIFKVERFLRTCVDSILRSTYRDIEVILVDDGSPDGCGAICDDFAARDSRVRVIHKANAGVSEARNSGIKAAKGDYIMFVDGDDVMHPRMVEVLHDGIESGDYDFAMVNVIPVGINGYQEMMENMDIDTSSHRVLEQPYCVRRVLDVGSASLQFHVPTNKLVKMSLVKDMFFKTTGGEDFEWNFRMFLRSRQGLAIDANLYFYIQHQASMTHSGINSTYIDRIRSYYLCLNDISVENRSYRARCLQTMYSMLFGVRNAARGTAFYQEAKDCGKEIYNKTKDELMSSDLPWTRKLRLLCFYHMPWLYTFVIKFVYGFLRR